MGTLLEKKSCKLWSCVCLMNSCSFLTRATVVWHIRERGQASFCSLQMMNGRVKGMFDQTLVWGRDHDLSNGANSKDDAVGVELTLSPMSLWCWPVTAWIYIFISEKKIHQICSLWQIYHDSWFIGQIEMWSSEGLSEGQNELATVFVQC